MEQRLRRQIKKENADVIGPTMKGVPANRVNLHSSFGLGAALSVDSDGAYQRELLRYNDEQLYRFIKQ